MACVPRFDALRTVNRCGIVAAAFVLFWLIYMTGVQVQLSKENFFKSMTVEPVVILAWTTFYGTVLTNDMLRDCTFADRCVLTSDRSLLNSSSAVMFHLKDLSSTDLPQTRDSDQVFVAFFWEPQFSMDGHFSKTPPDFYNLSLNYRQDGSIVVPFVHVHERQVPVRFESDKYLKIIRGKRKLVAWFVSNCRTESRREDYVKQLMKYITIDVYGGCGPLKCAHSSPNCGNLLKNDYKFYLSFENAICTDYVTEKFQTAVSNFVVPVVLKRSVYEHLRYPNSSFIAVDDFASPKQLAAYLRRLAANDTEYLKYFKWTSSHYFETLSLLNAAACGVCKYLHQTKRNGSSSKTTVVDNMENWYHGGAHCSSFDASGRSKGLPNGTLWG